MIRQLVSLVGLVCLLCFSFYSKASQTTHNISDDGNVHIPLDFPFPFYGRVFTDSWMFSNGVIGFMSPQTGFCCTGEDLSNSSNHIPQWSYSIMPLWTDLVNYGSGRFWTEGTNTSMTYGWENISEFGRPDSGNTFNVLIDDTGTVEFNFVEIDVNRRFTTATTGDLSQGEYDQIRHAPNGYAAINEVIPTNPSEPVSICDSDPLADPSCPGYADAYFNQQCSFDPLYNSSCPGYEQAYYDLQCSYNPLYDSGCQGYAEAYYDAQCSAYPLYDSGCPGYAKAYYYQQCSLDALYDTECPGYAEAVVATYVTPAQTETTEEVSSSSSTNTISTDVEEITETPITGDSVVDSVLREETDVSLSVGISEVVMEPTETEQTVEEVEETTEEEVAVDEIIETETSDSESEMDSELADSDASDDSESEMDSELADSDASDDSESRDPETEKSDKNDKREAVKKAVAEKAKNLANEIANATSLEAQKQAQAQVLALLSYVPDFNTYSIMMNGGVYPDAQGYANSNVPESRRGLRNGLAQQLLHEQMVEMQYAR